MKQAVALFFAVVAVVLIGIWSRSVGQQQAPVYPATDQRFCVDANGDGRLDISDATTLLNYLFVGNSTPYCVAQDVSLDRFASREDLDALRARVEVLESRQATASRIATGSYTGDGSDRLIETGLPGNVRFAQVWVKGQGARLFGLTGTKSDGMPGSDGTAFGISLSGSNFMVDATVLTDEGNPISTGLNDRGLAYAWLAFSTEE